MLTSRVNSQHDLGGGGGEGVFDHLMNTRIFTLTMNKIFMRQMAMGAVWIYYLSCTLCFISYEKWV